MALSRAAKWRAVPAHPKREAQEYTAYLSKIATDAFVEEVRRLRGVLTRKDAEDLTDPAVITRHLEKWATSITNRNAGAWGAVLKAPITGDMLLEDLFPAWQRTNFELITSLQTRARLRASKTIAEGTAEGLRVEQLGRELQAQLGISRRHSRLIARDQTLTLNGQATREYQIDAGIQRFEWLSSGDARVRDDHVELNGQIFYWNSPPPEGFPGKPIQCRCAAYPVISSTANIPGLQ